MKRYWVIAPYRSNKSKIFDKVWEYDIRNGCIATGWKELDNIFKEVSDKDTYNQRYEEAYKTHKNKISYHDRDSFWDFYHGIAIGDIIIARRGRKKMLAVGEVIKTAYYDESKGKARVDNLTDDFYANFLDINWSENVREFKRIVFPMFTIQNITPDYFHLLLSDQPFRGESNEGALKALEKKKQAILYGPPGTGKTYYTKELAVRLVESLIETNSDNDEEDNETL